MGQFVQSFLVAYISLELLNLRFETLKVLGKMGGSPGLVVLGDTSCDQEVISSNPSTVYWKDIYSH